MDDPFDRFDAYLNECYAQGDLEKVERFLCRLADQGDQPVQQTKHLVAAYNELGALYRGISRYGRSLAAFARAAALSRSCPGEDQSEYATLLNNMAGTCRLMRDYPRAIQLFLQAMALCRQAGLENSYVYVSVLRNLSLACQESRQYRKAIAYLEEAAAIIQTLPDHSQELAVVYNNLVSLYHDAGDGEAALRCVNRALQEYENCPEEEREHYAEVLNSLAGFLFGEGESRRALALYRTSAQYLLRFEGETESYALTCQNMRWVYEKLGDRAGAAQVLSQAEKVYARLLGPDHERTRAVADDVKRLREEPGA